MKKECITPEIRVTELTEDMTILAGSDTGNKEGYDNGGVEDVEDLDANETKPAKWGSVWD